MTLMMTMPVVPTAPVGRSLDSGPVSFGSVLETAHAGMEAAGIETALPLDVRVATPLPGAEIPPPPALPMVPLLDGDFASASATPANQTPEPPSLATPDTGPSLDVPVRPDQGAQGAAAHRTRIRQVVVGAEAAGQGPVGRPEKSAFDGREVDADDSEAPSPAPTKRTGEEATPAMPAVVTEPAVAAFPPQALATPSQVVEATGAPLQEGGDTSLVFSDAAPARQAPGVKTAPGRHVPPNTSIAANGAVADRPLAIEATVPAPLFAQSVDAAGAHAPAFVAGSQYPVGTAASDAPPVAVQAGRFGFDIGVTIARALTPASGREETAKAARGADLMIRLSPRHMGRVDVRLSFEDGGLLRAVVSADSPAALDMLRRESADLGRALADAGIRADAQSLRFDSGGGSSGNGPHRQGWRSQNPATPDVGSGPASDAIDDLISRPLRGSGRIDLMA
ncbi:MAG TPA: flagellar hook-length control protein FliK [Novosphingobium sp.]|nr:flagellar hook-length control protein FliK [Novosphingobium sp.]